MVPRMPWHFIRRQGFITRDLWDREGVWRVGSLRIVMLVILPTGLLGGSGLAAVADLMVERGI